MRTFLIAFVVLFGAALPGFSQGGGVGGGGFGGGGMAGGSSNARTPDTDLTTATNILSPGQQSEWALAIKDGETIIASATTTNFDPAIQIVDKDGKLLAENDDVRLGVQDALLVYRFPSAGSYKLLVKAFKGAGGGQFKLTLRRFIATEIKVGARTTSGNEEKRAQFYRFPAEVGQTLLINLPDSHSATSQVFSPTGESLSLNEPIVGRPSTVSFRAEAKGDYYLRVGAARTYAFTVATARVAPLTLGQPSITRKLGTGGVDIWTFTATAGDFVRLQARAEGRGVEAQLTYIPPTESEEDITAKTAVATFATGEKSQGELVALLRKTGTYELTLAQLVGLEMDYTLTSTKTVRGWELKAPLAEKLALGGTDYYAIEGKAGEILRLEGLSEQFDIELELYNLRGERLASNDDGGKGRNALVTVLLTGAEKYLLKVHCYGDGGSGTYQLRRAPDPVRPLKLGERGSGTLSADGTEIWSFTGKASQALILSVRSNDFNPWVRVFGPDGVEISGEGTGTLYGLTLPLEGTYTIWVSRRIGAGKYTVRLIEAE